MPRVSVTEWLDVVDSKHGPMQPELRHLCHVLARTLPKNGAAGAYRGSRDIGERMGVHRSTVSRHISALASSGWLELEERRTQFGRKGYTYFPAMPLAHPGAPISSDIGAIGASKHANRGNGAAGPRLIGAAPAGIGAQEVEIGAPGRAGLLQTLAKKSAAPPPPAAAGSAAQEEIRARVWTLLRCGRSDEQIVSELAGRVSPEQVQVWRRMREAMPLLARRQGAK